MNGSIQTLEFDKMIFEFDKIHPKGFGDYIGIDTVRIMARTRTVVRIIQIIQYNPVGTQIDKQS